MKKPRRWGWGPVQNKTKRARLKRDGPYKRGAKDKKYQRPSYLRARVRERTRAFYAFLRAQGVSEKAIRALQRKASKGEFEIGRFWP